MFGDYGLLSYLIKGREVDRPRDRRITGTVSTRALFACASNTQWRAVPGARTQTLPGTVTFGHQRQTEK